MVVGECLTKRFDSSGKKLEFEYEMDDDIKLLKVLCGTQEELKKWFISQSSNERIMSAGDTDKKESKSEDKKGTSKTTETDSDEDSDDGLQPYAMPDESQEVRRKAPVYLRDIMAGLLCHDDRERVEACLLVVESVICSQPDNLDEVAVELVKILLHLQDAFSLDDFVLFRHRAMTATAVRCPHQVSH
jgi:telomere length regulation protein